MTRSGPGRLRVQAVLPLAGRNAHDDGLEALALLGRSVELLGTPHYVAPEIAARSAKDATTASDVYSLGAILYECLTGRPPFHGPTPMETLQQVLTEEPVSPRRLQPGVPADLETICLKCLQKEQGKRYASALELSEDLRRFRQGEPIRARPVSVPERAWSWCRRNPAVAMLMAAVAFSLLGGAIVATYFAFEAHARALDLEKEKERTEVKAKEAMASAIDAKNSAAIANKERNRAREEEAEAKRNLYVTSVNLAQQALEAGDAEQARDLLQAVVPKKDEKDLRNFEWYYLWRLCHSGPLTFRHPDEVRTWMLSPDGKTIATGGDDYAARLWDVATGRELATLKGHTDQIHSVAFFPNGGRLFTGSADRTAKIWDVETQALQG